MALVVGTNSYGSRAEADTYFADSLKADEWKVFTSKKKDQGLVEVTRILERENWLGEKEVPSQLLAFGRTGLTQHGDDITAAESLTIIKTAQFEYAYALLSDPKLLGKSDATGSNVKSVKGGSARVEFFRATKGGRYPTTVTDIIKEFINGKGGISGSFASGTGDCTEFESGKYDKSRGFY